MLQFRSSRRGASESSTRLLLRDLSNRPALAATLQQQFKEFVINLGVVPFVDGYASKSHEPIKAGPCQLPLAGLGLKLVPAPGLQDENTFAVNFYQGRARNSRILLSRAFH